MGKNFVIAALLVVAASAQASACDLRKMPPAYFDHEPTVPYRVFKWDVDMLRSVCWGPYFANPGGCAENVSDDMWFIYLNAAVEHPECLLRHEKGHVNGWEHSAVSSSKGREAK